MTQSNVHEYFQKDHKRLDELFKSFQELKHSDPIKAKEAFKEFKFGLQRHIVWEEDVLFPAWEHGSGFPEGGPTHVMRLEHRQIGECLEALHAKVQECDPRSDTEEQQLLRLLGAHNLKEERILYPAIEALLEDEEQASLFKAMEAIPRERYETGCGRHR